jgi:ABC-2 type transport system ATP-binding protein
MYEMIEITDLSAGTFRQGWRQKSIVSGLSLRIQPGFFALLGPSGAGKSTLLRVLATLDRPSSGDAVIDGHSVRRDRLCVRRLIGYVPQVTTFYADVRVLPMLRYLAALSGLRGSDLDARCSETLVAVHLAEYGRARIKELSGGLRQRLALAQALVHEPRVLLADEPLSGLDPEAREHLLTLLSELALERTLVVATHLVADIAPVCTQLAVLQHGRTRFTGTPETLAAVAGGKTWQQLTPDSSIAHSPEEAAVLRLAGYDVPGFRPVTGQPTVEEGYLALIGEERQSCA